MSEKHPPVQQDDDILGGTLVFTGTRVPVHTLIAYLSANDTIGDFPTVSREQIIDYLSAEQPLNIRIAGLGEGTIWMSDDFDDPLPDEFWLGDDA